MLKPNILANIQRKFNSNPPNKKKIWQIILYWEYKLIRFRFLCIISKQNEWTDQLKYCPSLPTTFSHLSGNFRIPSRTNDSSLEAIQFWSQFSISAKEVNRWLAASFGTTINQEQCPENMTDAVKHPIWAFPFVYDFSDMRPSVEEE